MAKKRFIAGAKCPRCGELDKIITYQEAARDFRECIACGFKDELKFNPQVAEPQTRVSKRRETDTTDAQVLHFSPNKRNK